jgi:hypothetical protein
MKMKKTVLAVFCLAASLAWAQDSDDTKTDVVEAVDVRISVIEVIDVTAEKELVESIDEPDAEIDAILNEVDSLEKEDESE